MSVYVCVHVFSRYDQSRVKLPGTLTSILAESHGHVSADCLPLRSAVYGAVFITSANAPRFERRKAE